MLFFAGLLIAVAAVTLVMRLIQNKVVIKWYEWLLGAMSVVLVYLTIDHYIGSLNEFEPKAGLLGLAVLGGAALLIGLVDFQLIWRRNKKSKITVS